MRSISTDDDKDEDEDEDSDEEEEWVEGDSSRFCRKSCIASAKSSKLPATTRFAFVKNVRTCANVQAISSREWGPSLSCLQFMARATGMPRSREHQTEDWKVHKLECKKP
ncbi:hypothetical protein HK102_001490 [Quaeritorhiza haematococci]|nr:hypothetical protein HK102_001490 [Quaeritorhiza haematococci]